MEDPIYNRQVAHHDATASVLAVACAPATSAPVSRRIFAVVCDPSVLRLHHCGQLAGYMWDLPCGSTARGPLPHEQKRVHRSSRWAKSGAHMNKIGWFIKSKQRTGYTPQDPAHNRVVRVRALFGTPFSRSFEARKTAEAVWGVAHRLGAVGAGLRTRFGGVSETYVNAPPLQKKRVPDNV